MSSSIAQAFAEAEAKAESRVNVPIECASDGCGFVVVIDEVDPRIGYLRMARTLWFEHMREEHADEYAKITIPRRRRRGRR